MAAVWLFFILAAVFVGRPVRPNLTVWPVFSPSFITPSLIRHTGPLSYRGTLSLVSFHCATMDSRRSAVSSLHSTAMCYPLTSRRRTVISVSTLQPPINDSSGSTDHQSLTFRSLLLILPFTLNLTLVPLPITTVSSGSHHLVLLTYRRWQDIISRRHGEHNL